MTSLGTQVRSQKQHDRTVLVPRTIVSGRPREVEGLVRLSGLTMGTSWSVSCYADRSDDERDIGAAIARSLDSVVQEMSTWLPSSDISRYNVSAAGAWHDLSGGFYTVLAAALDLAALTRGAYDPTLGTLVQLWGFGSSGSRGRPPADGEIAAAAGDAGWTRIAIDHEKRRVLQPGGVQLDLSSIAKGYGVDEIARCLERRGITSYLCEIGGELRGSGMKPDGSPWWVALEMPAGQAGHETLIALHGVSVATSGDYARFFDHGGRRYGHTLDPRTGRPLTEPVTVSVIADDCMRADALATALSVLGLQDGLAFADSQGIAARFVCGVRGSETFSTAAQALRD